MKRRAEQRKSHEREESKTVRREQETEESGWSGVERVEPEKPQGAPSTAIPENGSGDSVNRRKSELSLADQVLELNNMYAAMERVVSNRGSAGIDGMKVEELQGYLPRNYKELCESIRGGWYKPKPVKRVEIPKPDGGKRMLGVPTVLDRMVQQAIVQVLQPIFEQIF